MIRVVVVEDQQRFRDALCTVLGVTPDLQLAGAFASVEQLEAALKADPEGPETWHVVLMDLELPGRDGVAGLTMLKSQWPHLRVVMCTVYEDAATVRRAIEHGADGYLVKRTPLPELLHQVRKAGSGGSPVSAEVASNLLALVRKRPAQIRCTVALDGSRLTNSDGTHVDLKRRRNVRLLLAALAAQHLHSPGQALSAQQCLDAAWPGERMHPNAARSRLWTSIRALRSMGLGDDLETWGSGYRLSKRVGVAD